MSIDITETAAFRFFAVNCLLRSSFTYVIVRIATYAMRTIDGTVQTDKTNERTRRNEELHDARMTHGNGSAYKQSNGARKNFNPCLRITANLDRDHRIDVFPSKASLVLTKNYKPRVAKLRETKGTGLPLRKLGEMKMFFFFFGALRLCNIAFTVVYFSRRTPNRRRAIVWN